MVRRRDPTDLMQYLERWGELYENLGSTRVFGRIMGWLLVSDPPEQTAKVIAGAIGMSLASVSTATRTLVQAGMVERVRVPGERSAHFRLGSSFWVRLLERRMQLTAAMRGLADEGLRFFPPGDREGTHRLRELSSYCAFAEKEFPAMVARWERRRRRA